MAASESLESEVLRLRAELAETKEKLSQAKELACRAIASNQEHVEAINKLVKYRDERLALDAVFNGNTVRLYSDSQFSLDPYIQRYKRFYFGNLTGTQAKPGESSSSWDNHFHTSWKKKKLTDASTREYVHSWGGEKEVERRVK